MEEGWKKEEFNVNQRSEKKKRGTITKVQALHRIPNKRRRRSESLLNPFSVQVLYFLDTFLFEINCGQVFD